MNVTISSHFGQPKSRRSPPHSPLPALGKGPGRTMRGARGTALRRGWGRVQWNSPGIDSDFCTAFDFIWGIEFYSVTESNSLDSEQDTYN
jgi:hypothetical protein